MGFILLDSYSCCSAEGRPSSWVPLRSGVRGLRLSSTKALLDRLQEWVLWLLPKPWTKIFSIIDISSCMSQNSKDGLGYINDRNWTRQIYFFHFVLLKQSQQICLWKGPDGKYLGLCISCNVCHSCLPLFATVAWKQPQTQTHENGHVFKALFMNMKITFHRISQS